ncbi:C40 family peptidase [Nocardiopsis sp. NPDC006139]|uniref:C40 family peptidase n=1 Tax=Nocardiopsis sp. NPDC006139 TaxID=3154578 RepID=UPI0015976CFF|nr:C40 family peptidase [Nocardiopsis flavescens]
MSTRARTRAKALWSRLVTLVLPAGGRDGDRGSAALPQGGGAARVGGGVTALAVMGGIAYAATMCGPTGATSTAAGDFGAAATPGGVIQASASTDCYRPAPSTPTTITISAHGEPGSSTKTVRVDVPADILRIHRSAAEAYDLPWELMAAIGAIETQNGNYVSTDPQWHSGLCWGQRNPYGAAGIVQFGVQDPVTGQVGGRLGNASNAWGGKPDEPVSARVPYDHKVGTMPANPRYFGIDGNADQRVNVWDPADNITSGAFRIAYYARQAEQKGSSSVCGRSDLTPMQCTVFRHNPAKWYVDQVFEVAEYYRNSGIAPTSPSLNIVQASSGSSDRECEGGGGATQAAFLGDVGEAHRRAVEFARAQLGKPYVWGGRGPDSFDCSGLTQGAWRAAGVQIPWVTTTQWDPDHPDYRGGTAERVQEGSLDVSVLQPGDLLFFHTNPGAASPSHVGIYAGGGMMVHAANSRKPIEEVPLDSQYYRSSYIGAVRITPDGDGPDSMQV